MGKNMKTGHRRVECDDAVKNQGYQTGINVYVITNFWVL